MLQRAGRSGHQPGIVSRVTCAPTSVFELVEDAAARAAGLEQSASRVALEFVIAGDDPNFPGMLEPDLRRTEDVARRVVRDADAAAIHSFTVRQHGDVGGTDPDIEESATGSAARYARPFRSRSLRLWLVTAGRSTGFHGSMWKPPAAQ